MWWRARTELCGLVEDTGIHVLLLDGAQRHPALVIQPLRVGMPDGQQRRLRRIERVVMITGLVDHVCEQRAYR